jgi:long-chain acyl-CoA synthetase
VASQRTLASALREAAAARGGRVAVLDHGTARTYEETLGAVDALASGLAAHAVGPGSRVAVLAPNGAPFVTAFFAAAHLGAVVMPLNPLLTETELAAAMRELGATVLLTAGALRERARRAAEAAGLDARRLMEIDAGGSPRPSGAAPAVAARPDDPVLCLSSSGSTGRPKPVERTHRQLLFETERLTRALALSGDDRVLGVAPFSHVNGLMRSMVAGLLSGATLVTMPRFERSGVAAAIQEHRITVFVGVPFMFAVLAETRWPRPADFSSLRLCLSASAPLRRQTALAFPDRYGAPLRQLYGTTETGTIALNLDPDFRGTADSVGRPLEGVEVAVVSPGGRPLPPGEVGEIGIRSPAAARGYLGAPAQTVAAFREGYFFPGDVGYADAAGRLYLTGRTSLFINRGAHKVNPYELEELLERHPKVREVAVVGVAGEHGEEKVKAVVVASEPCDPEEIIAFCRSRLADFKIPSIVELRTELPRSASGKVLRTTL